MPHYKNALKIIDTLHQKGFTAYIAGGWVRDYLLDHTSDDIDIVTEATLDELKVLFPKTIEVGAQFGILVVIIDEDQYEVATFRKESGYEDGRRPSTIKACDPEQDAQRRDFTINGMFYDPINEEVLDYVDGKIDLKQKMIRAIGNPLERFEEDRLRMIRAIRYACRFGFEIEKETLEAIKTYASELYPSVSVERIYQEFNKMANFPHFEKALIMLHEVGLLAVIFPILKDCTTQQIQERIEGLEKIPIVASTSAKLTLLFPNIQYDILFQILKELKISNKEIAVALYFAHLKEEVESEKKLSRYSLALLFADPHFELCFEMLKVLPMNEKRLEFFTSQHILLDPHTERLQNQNPIITATKLMQNGFTPGQALGAALKEAERISIEEDIIDEELLLQKLLHLRDK